MFSIAVMRVFERALLLFASAAEGRASCAIEIDVYSGVVDGSKSLGEESESLFCARRRGTDLQHAFARETQCWSFGQISRYLSMVAD